MAGLVLEWTGWPADPHQASCHGCGKHRGASRLVRQDGTTNWT